MAQSRILQQVLDRISSGDEALVATFVRTGPLVDLHVSDDDRVVVSSTGSLVLLQCEGDSEFYDLAEIQTWLEPTNAQQGGEDAESP